ncbi:MAG: hypothetical protein GC166_01715 [Alphaproteobacteria bacterium]|nr:hypothetical protein [Alphaproteobacteria bacterium]
MTQRKKKPGKNAEKITPKKEGLANLDLDPDAWPKFEALVKSAAKMGPKPHGSSKVRKKAARP